MVGTSVRDSQNEPTRAKTTASASGRNRWPATPPSWNIGTKTMHRQSSVTNAGMTICWAPSMIAGSIGLPISRW